MFPLGSVLLPSMVLPLHVFEARYRVLVEDVLAAPVPEFGVALIERGSEVGGGDIRAMTGCVTRIVEAGQAGDGRWALVTTGVRRIRVRQWLDDDPYPQALVEDWPDDHGRVTTSDLDAAETTLRRVVALASELGAPGLPADLEFSDDPTLRTYQFGVLAPLGALDRQRVLEASGPASRLALLGELLAEQEELLRAELAFGGGEDSPGADGPWS
jgi:uncharacterized protein